MGMGRAVRTGILGLALAGAAAAPALAQFSDSYNFLKAVRDADGAKTQAFLDKPGSPALDSRDGSTGETALHIVVKRHDQAWLAVLLARGARTEIRDKAGDTPLMTAALLSDAASVQLLLQRGAQPDAADGQGETPLIIAVQRRDLPTIRLLLAAGANPKLADHIAGKSAHDYAAEDTRGTAVLRLLDEAKPRPPAAAIAGPVRR